MPKDWYIQGAFFSRDNEYDVMQRPDSIRQVRFINLNLRNRVFNAITFLYTLQEMIIIHLWLDNPLVFSKFSEFIRECSQVSKIDNEFNSIRLDIKSENDFLEFLQKLSDTGIVDWDESQMLRKVYVQDPFELERKSQSQATLREILYPQAAPTPDEIRLYEAIDKNDVDAVNRLLVRGVNPNLPPFTHPSHITSPMGAAVHQYYKTRDPSIIRLLMDYHADSSRLSELGGTSILSDAIKFGSLFNILPLLGLLMQYQRHPTFQWDINNIPPGYTEVANTIQCSLQRIGLFSRTVPASPTEVKLLPSSDNQALYVTEFRNQTTAISVETYLAREMSQEDCLAVFQLFTQNFGSHDKEGKKFQDIMAICREREIYCDVIKAGKNVVGFNIYEVLKGEHNDRLYQVLYCIYAYVDKAYRGTRSMSMISFRPAHVLQAQCPDIDTYIFYDAIHPSSFRQAYEMKPYPLYRPDSSTPFIKHILTRIFGQAQAHRFDGVTNFQWPTSERVINNPIDPNTYDFPPILRIFDEFTRGEGGVPVFWMLTPSTIGKMAELVDSGLNNPGAFLQHIADIVEQSNAHINKLGM